MKLRFFVPILVGLWGTLAGAQTNLQLGAAKAVLEFKYKLLMISDDHGEEKLSSSSFGGAEPTTTFKSTIPYIRTNFMGSVGEDVDFNVEINFALEEDMLEVAM